MKIELTKFVLRRCHGNLMSDIIKFHLGAMITYSRLTILSICLLMPRCVDSNKEDCSKQYWQTSNNLIVAIEIGQCDLLIMENPYRKISVIMMIVQTDFIIRIVCQEFGFLVLHKLLLFGDDRVQLENRFRASPSVGNCLLRKHNHYYEKCWGIHGFCRWVPHA